MLVVEEVRDLDGLSNGCGLVLDVGRFKDTKEVYVAVVNIKQDKLLYRTKIENTADIEVLKSFGFQFECKPKKSLEEVLSKYQETEFVFGEDNYFIATNKNQEFCYDYENEWKPIGTKYYSQEDCNRILDELDSKF